jgi:hypothetical protein
MTAPETQPTNSEALEAAYRAGNFAALHRAAKRVLDDPGADAALRDSAQQLDARIAVDPGSLVVLAFSALLLCAIVFRYVF